MAEDEDHPFMAYGPPHIRHQVRKDDPAPNPIAVQSDKLTAICNDLSNDVLNQFRALRDEIDEVMRSITDQQQHIIQLIDKLATDAESGIVAVRIVQPQLAKLKEDFRLSLPKVATLKRNGRAND